VAAKVTATGNVTVPSTRRRGKPSAVTGMTPNQEAVAEAVLDGNTLAKAAEIAGCSLSSASYAVKRAEPVKAHIAEKREELSDLTQLKRADIIVGFMEAIETARNAADPGSMIRGWSEIGKMLGLYAPEKVEVHMTVGQRAIQSKYEVMSDEELLAIAEGRGNVIDGEYQTVQ